MDWLALALSLVKLLGAFTGWLHDRAMISAGQAEAVAAGLVEQANAIKQATKARADVRGELAAHPERLRDDDGFKRK